MKPKKKSGFFTFCFSLLPGAAEMYMGFMRNGVSLMVVFFLSIMLPALMSASDVFMTVAFLIWFYGFFHARNLVHCDDEEFALLTDRYIWDEFLDGRKVDFTSEKSRKLFSIILILFGVACLWSCVSDMVYSLIPEAWWDAIYPVVSKVPGILISIIIIIGGIKLISGKKEVLAIEDKSNRQALVDFSQITGIILEKVLNPRDSIDGIVLD